MELTQHEITQLNSFSGFFNFIPTYIFRKFLHCDSKTILLTTGNQYGKTGGTAMSYVLRILGMHPVAKRNVVYYECECGNAVAPFRLPEDIESSFISLIPREKASFSFRLATNLVTTPTSCTGSLYLFLQPCIPWLYDPRMRFCMLIVSINGYKKYKIFPSC